MTISPLGDLFEVSLPEKHEVSLRRVEITRPPTNETDTHHRNAVTLEHHHVECMAASSQVEIEANI